MDQINLLFPSPLEEGKDYRLLLVGSTQVGLRGTLPSKSMIKKWLEEEKG